MNYKVYFEIYGKKLATTIKADSPDMAKEIIKSKIQFHKIDLIPGENIFGGAGDFFDELFKGAKK
jgi:hypothetical protein